MEYKRKVTISVGELSGEEKDILILRLFRREAALLRLISLLSALNFLFLLGLSGFFYINFLRLGPFSTV